ncbi:MAG: nitrite/sulfite reductase [Caulobacterales bacterium]|nr:nitrite/sulfite reductase [Caulobacterales bacterium]MCA0372598.1 nitrite/sulfite reductase [Pseudomonadota bacterium]
MYRYDEFDHEFVCDRVNQFKEQIERRLKGALSEEEFRPIRLRNGLYLQLHAYMLRVAIPYGTLNSKQLRVLADIGDKYDKGYGHFTTRQNIQYNWIKLTDVADILADLAQVEMHAIQTSGNCIRNVTSDHLAGVAKDEIIDPRPIAETIRQWSSNHPEFSYLGRKFKIAVTGAKIDRAAIRSNDVGIELVEQNGKIGARVFAGGGLGRTPIIGKEIKPFVELEKLLSYLDAVLRVFNLLGRRDNKYKARIKILVEETGLEEFIRLVEEEYALNNGSQINVPKEEIARIEAYFASPKLPNREHINLENHIQNSEFAAFVKNNTFAHKNDDYVALMISLKPIGGIPGDATGVQMRAIADIADQYSFGEIRISHTQNIVLPYVAKADLFEIWRKLGEYNLATANIGLISDIIACPGLDYCALATARAIPIAQEISQKFAQQNLQDEIGQLGIKISGCINACGHHHIGNIGILGLEKAGRENYQITIGGDASENMSLGERLGPGIDGDQVPDAILRLVNKYRELRTSGESFIETYRRVGVADFQAAFLNGGENANN